MGNKGNRLAVWPICVGYGWVLMSIWVRWCEYGGGGGVDFGGGLRLDLGLKIIRWVVARLWR